MKIYIVWRLCYECDSIERIFSNEIDAKKLCDQFNVDKKPEDVTHVIEEYELE